MKEWTKIFLNKKIASEDTECGYCYKIIPAGQTINGFEDEDANYCDCCIEDIT